MNIKGAMRQQRSTLSVRTTGPGLTEITRELLGLVADSGIREGLATIFCHHTSASLVIQENADPDVCRDLQTFFERIAPWDPALYRHGSEGPDDMPAHIRAALTQTSLSIPIAAGTLDLGTWQGVYLFEHRKRPHVRRVTLHLMGEGGERP